MRISDWSSDVCSSDLQESSRGNDRSEDSHGTTPKQHRAIDNRNYSVQQAAPARCNARCRRIAFLMEMFLLRRRQEMQGSRQRRLALRHCPGARREAVSAEQNPKTQTTPSKEERKPE